MIRYVLVSVVCFSLGGLIGETVGSSGTTSARAKASAAEEALAKAEASVHQCVGTVAGYNKLNGELMDLAVECRDGMYISGKIINRLTDMLYDWSCNELAAYRSTTPKAEPLNEGPPPVETLRVDGSILLYGNGTDNMQLYGIGSRNLTPMRHEGLQ